MRLSPLLIERLGLNELVKRDVVVNSIVCKGYEECKYLISKIDQWYMTHNTLLEKQSETKTYTYGGPKYNGRFLTGRDTKYSLFFSTFKISYSQDDGYIQSLTIQPLSLGEVYKYSTFRNYNPSESPSLLVILFSLVNNYIEIIDNVDLTLNISEYEILELSYPITKDEDLLNKNRISLIKEKRLQEKQKQEEIFLARREQERLNSLRIKTKERKQLDEMRRKIIDSLIQEYPEIKVDPYMSNEEIKEKFPGVELPMYPST